MTSVKSPSTSHPVICREILSRRSAISSFCSSVSSGGSSGSLTSSSSPPSASPSATAASSPSGGGGGVSLILRILASSPSTLEGVTRQNAPRGYTSRSRVTPWTSTTMTGTLFASCAA